jgi:hypothetical protein
MSEQKDSRPATQEPVSSNTPEPMTSVVRVAKEGVLTESMLKGESLGDGDKKG